MNDVISVIALVWRRYTWFFLVADFFHAFKYSMRCQVECLCERMFSIYFISVSFLSFCIDIYQHLHTFLYRPNLKQDLSFWIYGTLTSQLYFRTRNFVLKQKCDIERNIQAKGEAFKHRNVIIFFLNSMKIHEILFFKICCLHHFFFPLSFSPSLN